MIASQSKSIINLFDLTLKHLNYWLIDMRGGRGFLLEVQDRAEL